MPGEFFTIETLATFAGMVAAVTVIVQFSKGVIKANFLADWMVRVYTLAIALCVQFFVLYVQANLITETIGLGIINSVLVALTSMGGYEILADPQATKKQPEKF
jgi:hypothetical protein